MVPKEIKGSTRSRVSDAQGKTRPAEMPASQRGCPGAISEGRLTESWRDKGQREQSQPCGCKGPANAREQEGGGGAVRSPEGLLAFPTSAEMTACFHADENDQAGEKTSNAEEQNENCFRKCCLRRPSAGDTPWVRN